MERFAQSDANVDPKSGALRLSYRPKIGTEAYACVLYPGVSADHLDKYEAIHRQRLPKYLPIPALYRKILTRINGCFLFGTSLFGIPLSMAKDPPLLDRSVQQPHDVCTANEDWRKEYAVDQSNFFFASGAYSSTENVGYFLTPEDEVEAYLAKGKMVGVWSTFDSFLGAEIQRAESRYSEYEKMMEGIKLASTSRKQRR